MPYLRLYIWPEMYLMVKLQLKKCLFLSERSSSQGLTAFLHVALTSPWKCGTNDSCFLCTGYLKLAVAPLLKPLDFQRLTLAPEKPSIKIEV